MKAPMICLYALLDTKAVCIFSKTPLASGVHRTWTTIQFSIFTNPPSNMLINRLPA